MAAWCAIACLSCAGGQGEGQITALVWAPMCGLDGTTIELSPNFFSLDHEEDADILEYRIQRGSDFEDRSDGLSIQVSDATMLKTELLGSPIDLSDPLSPVRINFYLGRRCNDFMDTPVNYEAVSGTIVFEQAYVPWVSKESRESTARFTNVEFADRNEADTRHATVSAEFTFLFERGRPVQRFP